MEGAHLEITVHPKAKRNDLSATDSGEVRVHVTAPPERGKANEPQSRCWPTGSASRRAAYGSCVASEPDGR